IYLIIIVILFALAVSDLIVGVSNDAVNFLNSAIGSNAAPRYIIMIIASAGIIIGTTFSSGMMEVARKGIFHPEYFYFSEIMMIFLAVMLTDILLLDLFNTLALPTSTTVSIVFEILGAAVAVSLIKLGSDMETAGTLGEYINSASALGIISGILLSVIIAFVVGSIVQYLVRIVFSYNYMKYLKYFGSIWGGIAITAITYFIVIKGAKGSALMTESNLEWIQENVQLILLASFIGWTVILQLLYFAFKINVLRGIVLVGTFALAMAFAGNDLVNFIGVPVAGLKSYQDFIATPGASPDNFLMEGLTGSVKTNTYLLLIAGVIMVITLYFSRKARSVTKTEINLSRQGEGYERFGSTGFARVIVRQALEINETINKFIPRPIRNKVNKRFEPNIEKIEPNAKKDDKAYFDLVRASVNLTVASILISFATSLKLPLSTTYVTFMVAMGTSLSDRAWGRESAVYRITGVFTVIGGWFLTALIAFTAAFVVANIITHGGPIGIIIVLIIAVAFLIRTHSIHKKREGKVKEFEDIAAEDIEGDNIMKKCSNEINKMLETVINIFNETIIGVSEEDRKRLRNINKKVEQLNYDAKTIKNNVHHTLVKLEEDEIETGHYYVQVTDYLREMAHALSFIAGPSYDHVANQHRGLTKEQIDELKEIKKEMTLLFTNTMHIIENNAFEEIKELVLDQQQKVLQTIDESRKNQIKRIKKKTSGTKNSILYLQLLNEMKNFTLHTGNLLKAQRDFITNQESN
ncbi:MAG: inorganic phosphate transporter, partial [Bacteroidales bacterium]